MDYFQFLRASTVLEGLARRKHQENASGVGPSGEDAASNSVRKATERDRILASAEELSRLTDLAMLLEISDELLRQGLNPKEEITLKWRSVAAPPAARGRSSGQLSGAELMQASLHAVEGNIGEALPAFLDRWRLKRSSATRAHNLAMLYKKLGMPGRSDCVLGSMLLAQGNNAKAAAHYLSAPLPDAQDPDFLADFLCVLRTLGLPQRVMEIASLASREGRCPPMAYYQWAEALRDINRLAEARAVLEQGWNVSHDWLLKLQAALMVPSVAQTQAQFESEHQRASLALDMLCRELTDADASSLARQTDAIQTSFFLAYAGASKVDGIDDYARVVERALHARFPQHTGANAVHRQRKNRRLRIGYASSYTWFHTVARYFAGWLENADRQQFEIHLFPLHSQSDWMAGYLAGCVDQCHPNCSDTAQAAEMIAASDLDLLMFPEVGMDPITFRLAAMRLAPVQCAAWGHPVSTGLSTIDYFLSSDAMEPEDAADHYSERLITLPGLSMCVPLSCKSTPSDCRSRFGFTAEDVIYLTPQSLFKYQPKDDQLLVHIARRVEAAVFVFVEGDYPPWTRTLKERLSRVFLEAGLATERHIKWVPQQPLEDFLALNAASDVFLDSPGWSGGMTALDALSVGLPIVTQAGKPMRARHCAGMLSILGLTETTATDEADYVEIAVRLGQDANLRSELSRRIEQNRQKLFSDQRAVTSLEAFYRWALDSARPGDTDLFRAWPKPAVSRQRVGDRP